jgi:two-component sensor histidine kinase
MMMQDAAVVVVRVLYIDDDPALARLVQRHLQRDGYEVQLAADGPSGVSMAACGGYDVIALDHYMPGGDGLETLAELQKLPGLPPVVFVTGAEEPRIAVTAMRNGAADYVVKDVHGTFLPTLDAAIRRALEQERVRRDKEAAERALRESRDNLERLALQQAILLREVNHRVANSLQLISSLIDLQVRKLHDTEARDVLRQAAARVEAVSLVHRRLYTSSDVQFVELDQYVAGLVEELRRATASGTGAERIELRTEPIRVETDKAVSIGLIVNELVTNALKYAYPGRTEGIVRVALVRESGGGMTLSVEDDGVGLPESGLVSKGTGLGSMIVSAMAQTIGASVALERRSPGTRIAVRMASKAA